MKKFLIAALGSGISGIVGFLLFVALTEIGGFATVLGVIAVIGFIMLGAAWGRIVNDLYD